MKIIVTGGDGFIGYHLCKALVARGDLVYVVDRMAEVKRLGAGVVGSADGALAPDHRHARRSPAAEKGDFFR